MFLRSYSCSETRHLSLVRGCTSRLVWWASRLQGSACLCLPSPGIRTILEVCTLYMGSEEHAWFTKLARLALCQLRHLPSSRLSFKVLESATTLRFTEKKFIQNFCPFQSSLQTRRRRRRHFLLAPAIASALLSLFSHGPSVSPLCSLPCHPRPRLGAPGPSRARLYLELPEAAGDSPREQRDRLGLPCRGEAEAAPGLREEGASGRSRLCITEART